MWALACTLSTYLSSQLWDHCNFYSFSKITSGLKLTENKHYEKRSFWWQAPFDEALYLTLFPGASLFYGTDRNGTEQFRHIILRNGTGSNMYATAHMTAKRPYCALKCTSYRQWYCLNRKQRLFEVLRWEIIRTLCRRLEHFVCDGIDNKDLKKH